MVSKYFLKTKFDRKPMDVTCKVLFEQFCWKQNLVFKFCYKQSLVSKCLYKTKFGLAIFAKYKVWSRNVQNSELNATKWHSVCCHRGFWYIFGLSLLPLLYQWYLYFIFVLPVSTYCFIVFVCSGLCCHYPSHCLLLFQPLFTLFSLFLYLFSIVTPIVLLFSLFRSLLSCNEK